MKYILFAASTIFTLKSLAGGITGEDKIWDCSRYQTGTVAQYSSKNLGDSVSVDIEVTGERCAWFQLCMDENKQKFSKLLKTYVDFVWVDDNDQVYYSSALESDNK